MVEKQLDRIKTHLGRSPQGVFDVHYYLLAGYARSRRGTRGRRARQNPRHTWSPRPSEPAASSPSEPEACTQSAHGALVDTSVYLKPAKLLNVALDMLARLAPCLNLGVREFGHKDLLDTIGTDNRRK